MRHELVVVGADDQQVVELLDERCVADLIVTCHSLVGLPQVLLEPDVIIPVEE